MSIKDEIIREYKRPVISNPKGAVVHMGDCGIYNVDLGICTCGLHHWLWQVGDEVIQELYPKLIEEKCNNSFIEYLLQEFNGGNLYVKDKDEFVKVERPKPVSKEEVMKIYNEIFNKEKKKDE